MTKKMKIPFLSRNQDSSPQEDDILKTVNSMFINQASRLSIEEEEELYDNICVGGEENLSMDTMILGGLKSERLFYEPHGTRSLLRVVGEPKVAVPPRDGLPFEEESVMLAMESADPYRDFRKSMEEMMEIHGLKDWESWEELLGWYLRMNGKINHGFIVGAFIDLLVRMSPPCTSDSDSANSTSSSLSPATRREREKGAKKTKMIM